MVTQLQQTSYGWLYKDVNIVRWQLSSSRRIDPLLSSII